MERRMMVCLFHNDLGARRKLEERWRRMAWALGSGLGWEGLLDVVVWGVRRWNLVVEVWIVSVGDVETGPGGERESVRRGIRFQRG